MSRTSVSCGEVLLRLLDAQPIQIGEEQEHLAYGQPRIDARTGRHEPDPRLDFVGAVQRPVPADFGVAAVGPQQADNHP